MSELINNSEQRKLLLTQMIRELHGGAAPDLVRARLEELLVSIPYGEVVEVEQELIREGISQEEIQRFCDIHSAVLDGHLDHSMAKLVPPGHPVDTFQKENDALARVTARVMEIAASADTLAADAVGGAVLELRRLFNELGDLDKHYRRKENLLFPFLEQRGITGPPTVMWGKHDEIRGALAAARTTLAGLADPTPADLAEVASRRLVPAARAVDDMIMKEQQILFPMCMDTLTDLEWYEIHRQTPEIGFCLVDPTIDWKPKNVELPEATEQHDDAVRLPSGMLTPAELMAMLNTVPFDMTFVDANDKVKYFTQGSERIFDRNRAILGRDVRLCHPPSSVNIVDRILEDFKSGREDSAPFWIQLHGKFIHIEYFALRDPEGKYLGTLEVSQDLTAKRALVGEQRLLSYSAKEAGNDAQQSEPGHAQAAPHSHAVEHGHAVEHAHARIAPGDPVPAGHEPPAERAPRPDWAVEEAITVRVDATSMLGRGANPLGAVMESIGTMSSGELLHVAAPFYPAPMVDVLEGQGHAVWGEESTGGWNLWIRRA